MKLAVLTHEAEPPGEHAILEALFEAGLERCHVRKPGWPAARLEQWLHRVPPCWRPRMVLHSHHGLVEQLGLGGRHWPDNGSAPTAPDGGFTSRACHSLDGLRGACSRFNAVFFSPVFPSISKPGRERPLPAGLSHFLLDRDDDTRRRTRIFALGGVTASRVVACRGMGFDGVAVLGAVWLAPDPAAAFLEIQAACPSQS